MTVLAITGTGTGVGKTMATAALAGQARLAGIDVAVCKPVQTGTAVGADGGPGDDDLAEIGRLTSVTARYGRWRYPEPLAPLAAAQRAGAQLPTRSELTTFLTQIDAPDRLTLVEGAGGLLVDIGADGVTLRDVAADLSASVLVVVDAGLGTLNHAALTLESLAHHGIPCAGLVIGAWPAQPGAAELTNRDALARLAPVRAVLPAGAGSLSPGEFEQFAASAFAPDWVAGLV
ncbi:dethiobiotin synthase [Mycolicibacterium thermoresistibile]